MKEHQKHWKQLLRRIEKAQEQVQTLETRLVEIQARQAELDAQTIDEADVARALKDFDELWSVLLTPEKERVLRLLIDHIDYHGETNALNISWRLSGFAEFGSEVNGG